MQLIPGSSGKQLAEEIASMTNYPILMPEYKTFSDGERYLRFHDNPENTVMIIQSLHYPQEVHLFELLNLISTVKRLGSNNIC